MSTGCRMVAAVIVAVLLLPTPVAWAQGAVANPGATTYALWPFESIGVGDEDARGVAWHLRASLGELECIRLLEREKMEQLAQEAGLGLTYACSSTECLVEMGQLLQGSRVIGGAITRIGDVFGMVAVVVDSETGEQLASVDWRSEVGASLSGLLTDGIPSVRNGLSVALCGQEAPGEFTEPTDSSPGIDAAEFIDWMGALSDSERRALLQRYDSLSKEGRASLRDELAERIGEDRDDAHAVGGSDDVMATLEYFEGGKASTARTSSREVPYLPAGRKLATMETTKGTVVMELWEDKAPNTVVNFVYLANGGMYDGVEFHRVIAGFMAQTGDVERKGGFGGPGYSIPGEFDRSLSHTEGVISMARSQDRDSGGSQFFIMLDAAPHLDGDYAAFGKVVSGMDVIHRLKKGDSARNGTVTAPDRITKLRVRSVPR